MFPYPFRYFAPTTPEEAFGVLEQYGDEAKILAGGQSLLPMMKLRLAAPGVLIDINGISEWNRITEDAHALTQGSLIRHSHWEHTHHIRIPLLYETAGHIADPLVRNRGTVGGSLAHADPAADWGASLLALKAQVHVQSRVRERWIALRDFFIDTFVTVLEPQEIVTAIQIPLASETDFTGARYLKLERKVGDFAVVGVAVTCSFNDQGIVTEAGIGLAAVGASPLSASGAESLLINRPLTSEVIQEAAERAAEECDPQSDRRGSEEYKRAMVRVFVERGLRAIQADWENRLKKPA